MANIIKLKSSDIPSRVPKGLAHGELAVNIPDGKLYVGNANGDSMLLNIGKIPPSPTSIADAYVLKIQDVGTDLIKYGVKEPSFTDYKEWISTHVGQFPLFVVIKGITYIAFEHDETHIKAYRFNETTIQSIVSIIFEDFKPQFNIRAVNATFVEKSLGTEAVAEERDRAVKAEQELSSRIDQNTKTISNGGALRPLYEAIDGVQYNPDTGFYEIYKNEGGITDVTEVQMRLIYNAGHNWGPASMADKNIPIPLQDSVIKQTNLQGDFTRLFNRGNYKVICVSAYNLVPKKINFAFSRCRQLVKIVGGNIDLLYVEPFKEQQPFVYCDSLILVHIKNLKYDLSFAHSPNLSVDDYTNDIPDAELSSLGYLVKNAKNTSAITVTLHPTAFNKVPETLKQKATEKQISFTKAL